MLSFEELYYKILESTLSGEEYDAAKEKGLEYDSYQLDCLLHPKKQSVVWRIGECDCSDEEKEACYKVCPFDAISPGEDGIIIRKEDCLGCLECVRKCNNGKLAESKDVIPALKTIMSSENLVYAIIAPAFLGQFSQEVTPGMLRNALKKVGFDGMIEVALFADILTLKEALEFDENIVEESDYQLTSCCCPMWIGMIRKVYNELMPHIPPSVSPMIACGRAVKAMHPEATVVFIGPCVAKKAEAREKDLVGDVDYVLTFQEIEDIFDALNIDPVKMEESDKDHSSRAGRIYARAGGVSEAVKDTVKRLNPNRTITVRTKQADGVASCKAMLNELIAGNSRENFYEGMGCVGGCVGGPKRIIPTEEGRINVEKYGDMASYPTPIDNPYVIELLHRLGFDTIESLLEESDIFTRNL